MLLQQPSKCSGRGWRRQYANNTLGVRVSSCINRQSGHYANLGCVVALVAGNSLIITCRSLQDRMSVHAFDLIVVPTAAAINSTNKPPAASLPVRLNSTGLCSMR